MTPPDVYFAHIPKTAGSSLSSFIRTAYEPGACMPVYEWRDLKHFTPEAIAKYRCYNGHFGASFLSLLDRDVSTITFLRDPVERSLSHVKYATQHHRRHRLRYLQWTIRMALARTTVRDEWIKPPLRDVVSDLQTRSLGVDIDLRPLLGTTDPRDLEFLFHDAQQSTSMDAVLEQAKRRLDTMSVVGIVERFSESLQLVADLLGVPMPDRLPRENVSSGHAVDVRHRDSGEFSAEYIGIIESTNRYDQELYAYANQLLDKQLAARDLVLTSAQ